MKKFIPWIILGFIVVIFIFIQPFERIRIAGKSMSPTYKDGQTAWINKPAIWFGQLQRGDVVVYNENKENRHFSRMNRVIGLPGDTIKIENGAVYLNSQQLSESYVQGKTEILNPDVIAEGKNYTLNENEYFILGDNRTNSKYDSRSIGMINGHIKNISKINTFIIGKVFIF